MTMQQGMRTSFGMMRRSADTRTVEQVITTMTAIPIAAAFFKPVVTASVGHSPNASTKTGFSSTRPFVNSFVIDLSGIVTVFLLRSERRQAEATLDHANSMSRDMKQQGSTNRPIYQMCGYDLKH